MQKRMVKVFAPATIANLGPGFDVLGLAIAKPGDFVTARRIEARELHFKVSGRIREVPSDTKKNVAAFVAKLMMDEFHPPFGVELTLEKQMPIGSGLGSSAASSVAAAVACNALLAKPLKKQELLRFILEGERLASGSPHADNAAPSLFGGVCLIRSYDPLDIIPIPVKDSMLWVVVHPHVIVETKKARSVLPKSITLRSAIRQWGNVGGLTYALAEGNMELIGRCIEDGVIEPVRARLIPGFSKVKEAALRAGAHGCSISGSGPSLFAVAGSVREAHAIGRRMKNVFKIHAGISSDVYISRVNNEGAKILWTKAR